MREVGQLSDEELIRDLGVGNADAMGELYARHGRPAYLLAYTMLRDEGVAEDVVQDSFLAVWRKAEQFDAGYGSLRTWLLSIVRNRAIDVIRSGRRQRLDLPLLDELEETAAAGGRANVSEQVERAFSRKAVADAVAGLPEDQRRTVQLIYFGGYTYEEAARLTNTPLGTVKSRLRAAFQKLRPLLAEERQSA